MPDLRAALTWFENAKDVDSFVRLTAALAWFGRYRSYRTEGRMWLNRAIELARTTNLRTPARPQALAGAAVLRHDPGRLPRGRQARCGVPGALRGRSIAPGAPRLPST